MRIVTMAALLTLAGSSAMAEESKSLPLITDGLKQGDVVVRMVLTREFRIFPSLPPERSGTVPVHLHFINNRADDGGGYGGFGGSGYNGHGSYGPDGFGQASTAVSRDGLRGGSSGSGGTAAGPSGSQNGGTTTGPGGTRGGGTRK